jgi:hypothetical protein
LHGSNVIDYEPYLVINCIGVHGESKGIAKTEGIEFLALAVVCIRLAIDVATDTIGIGSVWVFWRNSPFIRETNHGS